MHAEGQLINGLSKMIDKAHAPSLVFAFETHLAETEDHVERLKEAFSLPGVDATPKACKGMAGLLEQGNEVLEAPGVEPRNPRARRRSDAGRAHAAVKIRPGGRRRPLACHLHTMLTAQPSDDLVLAAGLLRSIRHPNANGGVNELFG